MLPIIYTRQFLLAQWRSKLTSRTDAMIYSTPQTLFAADRGPSAEIPSPRGVLVHEGVVHYRSPGQQVMLGLMETTSVGVASHSPGIAVAIDLRTGLVTDLVNDQGVLGYLESRTLSEGDHFSYRLELDVIGRVCVPRLIVDDDVILHPSVYLDARKELCAVTGLSLHPKGDASFSQIRLELMGPPTGEGAVLTPG